jgi:hypothetical protein
MENQSLDKDEQKKTGKGNNRLLIDSNDWVRNFLALIIVGGFVIGIAVHAFVIPTIEGKSMDDACRYIKDISSIFNGLIGMIVGYYFGKS